MILMGAKNISANEYCRMETNGSDMMLAKEWNALNSGLLKQLFDRHYILAERKARESMWLVPPFISGATSKDACHIDNNLANLFVDRKK